MREMGMWRILPAIGLAALGVLFLGAVFFRNVTWHWGRRGPNPTWPFTAVQQKVLGLLWGVAVLILSVILAIRAFSPGSIGPPRWNHLLVFLVTTGAASTWLMGLVDPRARALARDSRTGKFVISVNWLLALIVTFIAILNLWLLLRG